MKKDNKKKKLAIILPLSLLALSATIAIPVAVVCTKPNENPDPSPSPVSTKCNVTFDSNYEGGSKQNVSLTKGEKVTKPDNPIREGYDFNYWYKGDSDEEFDFNTPITESITLKAHWTQIEPQPEICMVGFDLNYEGSTTTYETVIKGQTIVKPIDPVREGYNFNYWYHNDKTTAFDFNTPITESITLKAYWTKIPEPEIYVVTFDSDYAGGRKEYVSVKDGQLVKKPTDPTRRLYDFDYWYHIFPTQPFDFNTPITESITLTAHWTRQPFTGPTFKMDGTVLLGFNDDILPEEIVERFPDGILTLPDCTEIADNAFDSKIPSGLHTIVMPAKITKIGDNALANNRNITRINFCDNETIGDCKLEYLGDKALSNTCIESFVFGKDLKYVGQQCFDNCTYLNNIDLVLTGNPSDIELKEKCFSHINSSGTITVRKSTSELWKTILANLGITDDLEPGEQFSSTWTIKEFTTLDIDNDGICYGFRTDLPDYLQFLIELEAKELVIPNNVVAISNFKGGFDNNKTITKLTIPSSVQNIDDRVFSNCSNLSLIDLTDYESVPNWLGNDVFINAHSTGQVEIHKNTRMYWTNWFEQHSALIIDDEHWKIGYNECQTYNCLGMYAQEAFYVSIEFNGSRSFNIEYTLDDGDTWNAYKAKSRITVPTNKTIYFRGDNPEGLNYLTSDSYMRFKTINGRVHIKGNPKGLLNKGLDDPMDEIPNLGCFCALFDSCSDIVSVDANFLPFTKLKPYCYAEMFRDCLALENAPKLPATQLEKGCYRSMFNDCYKLINPPELPAQEMVDSCYLSMFINCKKLAYAPELPAKTLARCCYQSMFTGCETITKTPKLPATESAQFCYQSMFNGCTSLTTCDEICIETFNDVSFGQMFKNCSQFNYVKVNFKTWPQTSWIVDWLKDVSPEGTFVCPSSLPEPERSESTIPEGWVISKY